MLFRNIFQRRFIKLLHDVNYFKRNLILLERCSKYAGKIIPLQLPKYSRFTFLSLMYVAATEPNMSDNVESGMMSVESAISQADELFSAGKFEESWKVLEPFKTSDDVEILWRISRALYNLSKQKGISKIQNASLIQESFSYIEKALAINDSHYAIHKWMAILYDAKSALDGTKARINALPVFKQHLMTAIELNPHDATSIYMLGQYMYNLADMSWLQRSIAKALFGTPPEATFEEAFQYFSKAEEVEPNFYSANLLMLGKTCLKLKKTEVARYWLKCALAYPVRTDEDESVRLEAEDLLKKHPGESDSSFKEKTENMQ